MMEHHKPSIEAPTMWGNEMPRPQCPQCQMRMILVAAARAGRRYECLRCGRADDSVIEGER